jgi:hypothetical protein
VPAGLFEDVVEVALPEEVLTGSPREASCPGLDRDLVAAS